MMLVLAWFFLWTISNINYQLCPTVRIVMGTGDFLHARAEYCLDRAKCRVAGLNTRSNCVVIRGVAGTRPAIGISDVVSTADRLLPWGPS